MRKKTLGLLATIVLLLCFTQRVNAAEHPIGQAVEKNGMEIGAVYLQPVVMMPTLKTFPKNPDAHLEADIHALKNNPNGFGVGEWIPYLKIAYHIVKLDKNGKEFLNAQGLPQWEATGSFMPMVANDGPHYGANVKFDGVGKYRLTYNIEPPSYNGFFHHKDKATGVGPWWKPFSVSWDFVFLGTGKKGGY